MQCTKPISSEKSQQQLKKKESAKLNELHMMKNKNLPSDDIEQFYAAHSEEWKENEETCKQKLK